MVLSENQKNKVYFSNLLALNYPPIWKEICNVLSIYGYSAGRLTYTKDYCVEISCRFKLEAMSSCSSNMIRII